MDSDDDITVELETWCYWQLQSLENRHEKRMKKILNLMECFDKRIKDQEKTIRQLEQRVNTQRMLMFQLERNITESNKNMFAKLMN